jgi:hypothetical protein
MGLDWLRVGSNGEFCDDYDDAQPINKRKFVDRLNNYRLLKDDTAPWSPSVLLESLRKSMKPVLYAEFESVTSSDTPAP